MKKAVAISLMAVTLAAIGYGATHKADQVGRSGVPVSYKADADHATGDETPVERVERAMKMKNGTKRAVGQFRLRDESTLELFTAVTTDGKECLIEQHSRSGAGAGCLDGGLFRLRKVEFSVSTEGGPETFSRLYVVGIVAPSIRSAAIELTDGTLSQLQLSPERTFVYESTRAMLEMGVYPTAFRVFGSNGKLVERVSFPPADS